MTAPALLEIGMDRHEGIILGVDQHGRLPDAAEIGLCAALSWYSSRPAPS